MLISNKKFADAIFDAIFSVQFIPVPFVPVPLYPYPVFLWVWFGSGCRLGGWVGYGFRYAHADIRTQVVVICGTKRYQLDNGGVERPDWLEKMVSYWTD